MYLAQSKATKLPDKSVSEQCISSPFNQAPCPLTAVKVSSIIFDILKEMLGCELEHNPKRFLPDSVHSHIEPDFFAKEEKIIGEIMYI